MENVSKVASFTLTGLMEINNYKYVYFAITLVGYLLIICFNCILISIIYLNKSLHEPMYIFLCALLVNALYGTSAFYPKLLTDLLSDVHLISYTGCLLQIFVLFTYAASEFTILTVMAYDRYVSICKPLHYHSIMTPSSVKIMLFLAWLFPVCLIGVIVILTSRLTLCGTKLEKCYCDNWSVVKLSCVDTTVNNAVGFLVLIIVVFPPLGFIVYSYIQILKICLRSSKEYRIKALNTCMPHLLTVVNYSINVLFEIIISRLHTGVPQIIRILMSVEYLVIPPLCNPIIYGLKLQEIRKRVKQMLFIRKVSPAVEIPKT
ncbi:olfactory receptor 52K1-like [Acipenser ruthenus]|uniref:olfactory receptor 52K1-like n=1 Tax=Acipenser ruthenus TaxID=7906 RepID=UPI00274162AD|nr:olfactory receptor 52K1-like [Acipenser ruthenus]